jgi:UDP-4-amino-4,6-dideoxy-N-acetyl-beta-L-altrosamine transaminase
MKTKFIPYGHQWIDDDDIKAVSESLKSDFITQGKKIDDFEKLISDYCHAKYAVAFSSGTSALHGAVHIAGITKGDEVITTPLTFIATGNSVLYNGGIVKFADIQTDTHNISPDEIKKQITQKTKAIIPVDFAGHPCELDEIKEIAIDNNLIVIEDACHALGAEYKNKKMGGLSDMTVFSFHPIKTITTGEGGMVLTNNDEYYHKLKSFRNHGLEKGKMCGLGYNYRITDFQCALGISQFKKLDKFLKRRKEIVSMYNDSFCNLENILIPCERPYVKSAHHLYVIQLLNINRRKVFDALRKENIGVQIHYIPIYHHPYYLKEFEPGMLGYQKNLCPNAELYYEHCLTLPLFPKMSDDDIEYIIEKVYHKVNYVNDIKRNRGLA